MFFKYQDKLETSYGNEEQDFVLSNDYNLLVEEISNKIKKNQEEKGKYIIYCIEQLKM